MTSGSSGVYVFLYSIFFYAKLKVIGFVATLLFFGYMFLISFAFFIVTGTIGFTATFLFVRKIYGAIKIDWVKCVLLVLSIADIFFFICHPSHWFIRWKASKVNKYAEKRIDKDINIIKCTYLLISHEIVVVMFVSICIFANVFKKSSTFYVHIIFYSLTIYSVYVMEIEPKNYR